MVRARLLIGLMLVACGSTTESTNDAGSGSDSATASDSSNGADGVANDASTQSDAPVGKTCDGCPPPISCPTCYHPAAGVRWQYQLTDAVDPSVNGPPYDTKNLVAPDVFDIDLYATDGSTPNAAAVTAIHGLGRHAICYVDAGTYEDFRPDATDFTTFDSACGGCLLGKNNGWPGEKWLDVNDDKGQRTFLLAELGKRIDKCVTAGFDGVELDNVDGTSNDTGFTITAKEQEIFNASIANLARSKHMSVALKNDVDQVADLEPYFDYIVNEQCFEFTECNTLQPFITAGKAVMNVEYNTPSTSYCPSAKTMGIDSIAKTLDLPAKPWVPCQ